nr:MAG TPA: hypothetical protein [Caudoviricetes sp.]
MAYLLFTPNKNDFVAIQIQLATDELIFFVRCFFSPRGLAVR